MKSQDIRQSFIDFFRQRDHREVASAPIVAHGDPTLHFTNAGMVPFKDVFLGLREAEHPRAVSAQKCLRVSGKHNDLENVGPSPRHHTFFEMLGNFSFGDYFKEDAIRFAWELVTGPWELDPANLFATVYHEDDEAAELWAKISSLPGERILRCGAKDNFWQMGETGPCGPCSEIFVDLQADRPAVDWDEGSENGRYLEIWNLVFMQFDRDENGQTRPLPNPSIDTGAGLERVASVLQKVRSNYETDLFTPLLQAAAELAGKPYGRDDESDVSFRVIADHLRAVAFLLADGVIPSAEGRGYVLRRLLRRAVRHGMRIGFEEPFLHDLVPRLSEVMGSHYTELDRTLEASRATVEAEEEKYLTSLATGARRIQEAIDRTRQAGSSVLSGEEIFNLKITYGQELDTIREIAEEERLGLDEKDYERRFEDFQTKAREGTRRRQQELAQLRTALQGGEESSETAFEGYDEHRLEGATVLRLAAVGESGTHAADALSASESGVVALDRTVFYAESGGQVGDRGTLTWHGGRADVTDTRKDTAGTYFHYVDVVEGRLSVGETVTLQVDEDLRLATERHHTGTHLLHAALHRVLGEGARQAGSLVEPERLRFDFTYHQPLSDEEIEKIEGYVNDWVLDAVPTRIAVSGREEALEAGAMALFGEKYGDEVRTVEIPGVSLELCGGCHVRNTGEIGPLVVTSERGTASGVRRIEAVTGGVALEELRRRRHLLRDVENAFGTAAERIPHEAVNLKSRVKDLERQVADLRREMVAGKSSQASGEIEVAGVKAVAREVRDTPTGGAARPRRHLARQDGLGRRRAWLSSRQKGHRHRYGLQGSDRPHPCRQADQKARRQSRWIRRRTSGLRAGRRQGARQAAGDARVGGAGAGRDPRRLT